MRTDSSEINFYLEAIKNHHGVVPRMKFKGLAPTARIFVADEATAHVSKGLNRA